MAEIKLVRQARNEFVWIDMASGDTGTPMGENRLPDKTVHCVSGAATIQGSNDGVNYVTINDIAGNPLTLSAGDMKVILENPLYLRPLASANGTKVVISGAE